MDEFGIETREGSPPELGGSELMPSAQARSDEPEAKTSARRGEECARCERERDEGWRDSARRGE